MNTFSINPNKIVGKIKPMNCGNNMFSFAHGYDDLFKDMQVPYVRLHDSATMNSHLVDIPAVFPNFDADETKEESYDFAFTDDFLAHIQSLGSKPYYRLGVTIENFTTIKPYNIYPPKDFDKWARICEHVIRHYNEGWANGFHYGIEYWEIWNEPENSNDIRLNQMWHGTFDEFMRLYEVASNHLKKCFPNIKIGGYGCCGLYYAMESEAEKAANAGDCAEYFLECLNKFLKYISSEEHKSPLDFFSWHSYANVPKNIKFARYAREILDKYGFTKCESHLNEWNTCMWLRGTFLESSNILANMLALQNEPLDMLMYYQFSGRSSYNSVLNPLTDKPLKAYYCFQAFAELYKLKNQVEVKISGDGGVYAVAAKDGEHGAMVITNNSGMVNWCIIEGIKIKEKYFITERNDKNLELVETRDPNLFDLFPFESVLIKF